MTTTTNPQPETFTMPELCDCAGCLAGEICENVQDHEHDFVLVIDQSRSGSMYRACDCGTREAY